MCSVTNGFLWGIITAPGFKFLNRLKNHHPQLRTVEFEISIIILLLSATLCFENHRWSNIPKCRFKLSEAVLLIFIFYVNGDTLHKHFHSFDKESDGFIFTLFFARILQIRSNSNNIFFFKMPYIAIKINEAGFVQMNFATRVANVTGKQIKSSWQIYSIYDDRQRRFD